jgi:hypothetical protein
VSNLEQVFFDDPMRVFFLGMVVGMTLTGCLVVIAHAIPIRWIMRWQARRRDAPK